MIISKRKFAFCSNDSPCSACSICFGIGVVDDMKPGISKGLQMVVKDVQAAHDELENRGVNVIDIETQTWRK